MPPMICGAGVGRPQNGDSHLPPVGNKTKTPQTGKSGASRRAALPRGSARRQFILKPRESLEKIDTFNVFDGWLGREVWGLCPMWALFVSLHSPSGGRPCTRKPRVARGLLGERAGIASDLSRTLRKQDRREGIAATSLLPSHHRSQYATLRHDLSQSQNRTASPRLEEKQVLRVQTLDALPREFKRRHP